MADDVDARLLDLAGRITDGTPLDWADPTTAEGLPDSYAAVLRALDALAREAGAPAIVAETPPEVAGFAIEGVLGRGGAGVVYRARDVELDRAVAIKTLPSALAGDAERMARLAREARTLASLDHPNIATIHGLAEARDGRRVLVLELVAGETLARRLARGPLAVAEALEVMAQVAGALEASHAGGVVHRDVKPANVMLAPRGRVKVLDFGLAHRGGDDPRAVGVAGTWAYLAPECLAREEDHRADVFAFGAVLYECLAGARAFPGDTADETLAAVVAREPELARLPREVPAAVRALIEDCLVKDPAHRLADIGRARRVLEAGRPAPVDAAATVGVPGLPRPATRFFGRGREHAAARAALATHGWVTLVGAGGVGKTRLATEVVATMSERFPDRAWFVDLAPAREAAGVSEAVAAAIAVATDAGDVVDAIAVRLGDAAALLALDNAEQVRADCAGFVAALRARMPALRVLVTSREPLRGPGEVAIEVEPLALPEADDAAAVARAESVQLFVDRALRSDPGFVPDASALAHAATICRRVDALPLAIELAAARVGVLGVAGIAARLDRPFALLRDASGRADARHATLRGTIAWSLSQLDPGEVDLFERLGVFVSGFDLEAAHAVAGDGGEELDTLDRLARLADKSLIAIARRGDPVRYRLLEPVREFAAERLTARPDRDAIRGRHVAHVVARSEWLEPRIYGAEQATWLARLAEDHDDVLAALDSAESLPGGGEAALRIVAAVRRLWILRGQSRLGEGRARRALALAGSGAEPHLRARGLAALASLLYRQNLEDRSEIEAILTTALPAFRAARDDHGQSHALTLLANCATRRGDGAAAAAFYEESLVIDRARGNRRAVAITTHNLGILRWLLDDLGAAHACLVESDRALRESGDHLEHANGAVNLALVTLRLGRYDEGAATLAGALATLAAAGSRTDIAASAVFGAAELEAARARPVEAAWLAGAADGVLAATGSRADPRDPPWDRRDPLRAELRSILGDAGFEAATAAGAAAPPAEALERALAAVRHG